MQYHCAALPAVEEYRCPREYTIRSAHHVGAVGSPRFGVVPSMSDEQTDRDRPADPQPRPSMVAETLRIAFRQLRRLVVFVIGTTVVLIGAIMLFTPGPAVVVIPIGLGILALEFAWARMLLVRFKERAEKLGSDVAERFRKDGDSSS